MGVKPESTLIPVKASSKGARILEALDKIASDYDIIIIRDDMCFDDEHTIVDLSAILGLVTRLALEKPVDEYKYQYDHLRMNNDQPTLF